MPPTLHCTCGDEEAAVATHQPSIASPALLAPRHSSPGRFEPCSARTAEKARLEPCPGSYVVAHGRIAQMDVQGHREFPATIALEYTDLPAPAGSPAPAAAGLRCGSDVVTAARRVGLRAPHRFPAAGRQWEDATPALPRRAVASVAADLVPAQDDECVSHDAVGKRHQMALARRGMKNPPRRNRRPGRVAAGHRTGGSCVENAVGHAVLDDGLRVRALSVAAPASCPGALRARIGLCRSPTRSPVTQRTTCYRR